MIDQRILIDRRAKSKRPSTRAPRLLLSLESVLGRFTDKGLEVHVSQLKTMHGKSWGWRKLVNCLES